MANINITSIIKNQIENYNLDTKKISEGKIIAISDGIATVSGLYDTQLGELLKFPKNTYGMALSLEEDLIGVILLGEYSHLNENDKVLRTKEIVRVPVGDKLLGRIVNSLGQAIDGKSVIKENNTREIERVALGIMTRQSVDQPLETGILAIDAMIPIGKGQRELIIGDRKTGKTAIAIDAIINQKGKNVKCVYVSIGQKNSSLAIITQKLIDADALKYTTIVAANSSESDAMQYIAPYASIAIAEEWMEKGEDVLIIFDDLSKHAVAYRSLSLLLRRPPGREAYPGDVFYIHSRLLERSARLNKKYGGGSITALPIIETQAGDISSYIPTNVISITDGQIFLMTDAFNSGQRPAVDSGFSVSRVGSAAQTKLIKKVAASLKLQLANYGEIKAFSEFSSDLDQETKTILENGEKIMAFLKQKQYYPYNQGYQAIILYIIDKNMIDLLNTEDISKFKDFLFKEINNKEEYKKIVKEMNQKLDFTDEIENKLHSLLTKTINKFNQEHN